MNDVLVVLTNCPDEASARRIARLLIENRLAACVNQLAPVQSIYRWQGTIETATEIPLLVKCTRERYLEVEQTIRSAHPYTVPEIIALAVERGFDPYLRWVAEETEQPKLA